MRAYACSSRRVWCVCSVPRSVWYWSTISRECPSDRRAEDSVWRMSIAVMPRSSGVSADPSHPPVPESIAEDDPSDGRRGVGAERKDAVGDRLAERLRFTQARRVQCVREGPRVEHLRERPLVDRLVGLAHLLGEHDARAPATSLIVDEAREVRDDVALDVAHGHWGDRCRHHRSTDLVASRTPRTSPRPTTTSVPVPFDGVIWRATASPARMTVSAAL